MTEIIGKATLHNMDCMELLKNTPDKFYDLAIVDDMAAGKAGEYLVCADLIMKGFIAYPSVSVPENLVAIWERVYTYIYSQGGLQ